MTRRAILTIYLVIVSAAGGAMMLTAALTSRKMVGPLGNPIGVVDRLVMIDSAEALRGGMMERARVVRQSAARIVLEDLREESFPRQGSWTLPPIEAQFPFVELLPSWNADVPSECGVSFEVRSRDAGSRGWSPWLFVGSWGRVPAGSRLETFRDGRIDIDNLQLARPADQFQLRAMLYSYSLDLKTVPAIRRVAACYSGVVKDAQRRAQLIGEDVHSTFTGARNLAVPFRTQKDAPKPLRGQICSPTSVSMVLDYWGIDRPTVENALAIYDADHDLFGNWARAVQFAGSLGLDAWLTRFRRWDEVRQQIAAGQPIIASIRFKKGEFPSSVLPSTDGHLLVIRGFTASGDVICNDPASKDRGNGVVYKASELGHAWFDHGGVGYLIRGPRPAMRAASRPSTAQTNAMTNIKQATTTDK